MSAFGTYACLKVVHVTEGCMHRLRIFSFDQIVWWPYLSDQSEHYAQFLIDAGFNTGFNLKDKVTLKSSIVLSLMLIVACNAEFYTIIRPNFCIVLKLVW